MAAKDLSAFFAENAVGAESIRYAASKRFVDKDGKPVEWEIACITSEEDEALRKACTRRVPAPGRKGQLQQETDFDQYLGKLAARCTAYPNLLDAALQTSYGVMGEDALLKKMLLPGEYANYLARVQEVNGFDISLQEQVDEVKN